MAKSAADTTYGWITKQSEKALLTHVAVRFRSGWRTSTAGPEFWEAALDYTCQLMEAMEPQAAGGFDFVSVGGRPVVVDVNTGRFNAAHYWKLFKAHHAPQVCCNEAPALAIQGRA